MHDYGESGGSRASFRLMPAVPHPAMCADELDCSFEKVTLCAFDEAGESVIDRIPFLSCMDSHKLPLFYNESVPRACAEDTKLDWKSIDQCFQGKRGDELLNQAAKEVEDKIGNKSFSLPLVQVGGTTACTGEACSYDAISKKIPTKGSSTVSSGEERGQGDVQLSYFFSSK